jgi:hypothetical protein
LLWSTLVAVALAVAAVVAFRDGDASAHVAAKSESGATTPRRRTIVFRAREPFPPKFFDIVPPRGPSPGDEGIEKEFLSVNGRRIGYDLLHFNAIAPTRAGGPDVIADGVLVFRDGQVALQGETTFRHIRVAVVGGTGAYQGRGRAADDPSHVARGDRRRPSRADLARHVALLRPGSASGQTLGKSRVGGPCEETGPLAAATDYGRVG